MRVKYAQLICMVVGTCRSFMHMVVSIGARHAAFSSSRSGRMQGQVLARELCAHCMQAGPHAAQFAC
jgi:hypothetical protein